MIFIDLSLNIGIIKIDKKYLVLRNFSVDKKAIKCTG